MSLSPRGPPSLPSAIYALLAPQQQPRLAAHSAGNLAAVLASFALSLPPAHPSVSRRASIAPMISSVSAGSQPAASSAAAAALAGAQPPPPQLSAEEQKEQTTQVALEATLVSWEAGTPDEQNQAMLMRRAQAEAQRVGQLEKDLADVRAAAAAYLPQPSASSVPAAALSLQQATPSGGQQQQAPNLGQAQFASFALPPALQRMAQPYTTLFSPSSSAFGQQIPQTPFPTQQFFGAPQQQAYAPSLFGGGAVPLSAGSSLLAGGGDPFQAMSGYGQAQAGFGVYGQGSFGAPAMQQPQFQVQQPFAPAFAAAQQFAPQTPQRYRVALDAHGSPVLQDASQQSAPASAAPAGAAAPLHPGSSAPPPAPAGAGAGGAGGEAAGGGRDAAIGQGILERLLGLAPLATRERPEPKPELASNAP